MNDSTAELLAMSAKIYDMARVHLKKNLEELRDVKQATTFVAPFVVAAKMFLSKTGLPQDEQKKILLELIEKVSFVEGRAGGPLYFG